VKTGKVNSRNHKDLNLKRINKTSIAFNNHELKAIDQYCQQFRVRNKAKFMREAIITEVLRNSTSIMPPCLMITPFVLIPGHHFRLLKLINFGAVI